MFSSSLAAVLIMAGIEAQAGSLVLTGQSHSTFAGGTTLVGQKNATLAVSPLQATTNSHLTIAAVQPLQSQGAAVYGQASLPYALGTTLSLLPQIGTLLKPEPAPAGTTTIKQVRLSTASPLDTSAHLAVTSDTVNIIQPSVVTSANTVALASAVPLSPAYSSGSQQTWASGTSSPTLHLSGTPSSQVQNLLGSVIGSLFTSATLGSSITVTSGVHIFRANTTIAGTGSATFLSPILILGSGSLILSMPTSVDETDPGTAFSESNPVDLITSESGALFPVGTSVRVHGLMGPTAGTGSGVTATIINNSQTAMIIKQTSTGGLSFTRSVNTPPPTGTP